MSRLTLAAARLLVIATLLLAGRNFLAQAAPNGTPICPPFNTSTWNLAGSPYTVCSAGSTLLPGATLTIDPGVTVLFDTGPGSRNLTVQGKLIANGTVTQTITFTSTDHTPGSWGGLSIIGTALNPASASLRHTSLNYGGIVTGSTSSELYASYAVVTITDSLIGHSAGDGIYVATTARLDAHATNFVGNGKRAIELSQPTTDLLMTDLTATGNGTDGVFISGNATWTGQHRVTNPGVPYFVDGPFGNNFGDVLTVEPGGVFKFTGSGYLYVRGRLNAIGTPSEPLLFTGQTQTPGFWQGLVINGGQHQAIAQLDYVTLEYGGKGVSSGANIDVQNGRVIVHHSIIRHSLHDGVRFANNWGGSILESQIVSNADYGVRNGTPLKPVLATNNWWGAASGPQTDVVACNPGTGSKVTAGVFYQPVLISATATVEFPLSTAPILTVTPRRWFAPADGFTRIYFDITVRDGNGAPLPGRTVGLTAPSAVVTAGGVTDSNGHTLAYITSSIVGDSDVSATLNVVPCEGYLAPEIKVTFTTPLLVTDLYPNAQAPYFDDDITVGPLPIVTGVPATAGTHLTNPLSVPVTVDVSFGFATAGIGLVFGPLGDINGVVIPANGQVFLSMPLPNLVSGHYCIQISYAITAIGSEALLAPQAGGRQVKQFNLNVRQGPMGSPSSKPSLAKTSKAFKLVSAVPAGPTFIQKFLLGKWFGWALGTTTTSIQQMGGDPPRQDYGVVTVAVVHPIPLETPGGGVSVARAAAVNALNDSLVQLEANGTAVTTALDRYGGASAANNLQWASEQANQQSHFQELFGMDLLTYADRLDAFVEVLQAESETATMISASDVISYQQRLANTGFTVQEIADAHAIGLTDAQIETHRQDIIAADPTAVAGDLLTKYSELATVSRELGNALLNPPNFAPGFSISGSPGFAPQGGGGNTMVQVFNTTATFQLSNPLTQTKAIELRPRRVDLPGDWTIDISPVQVTLDPGEIVTITVGVLAGSPVPQGITPRLAVEGYIGSQLIGGMVFDIIVPRYDPHAGVYWVALPILQR